MSDVARSLPEDPVELRAFTELLLAEVRSLAVLIESVERSCAAGSSRVLSRISVRGAGSDSSLSNHTAKRANCRNGQSPAVNCPFRIILATSIPSKVHTGSSGHSRVEQDHRSIKKRIRPMLGFKSFADRMAAARRSGGAAGFQDGMIAASVAASDFSIAPRDTSPFEAMGLEGTNPWGETLGL